MEAKRKIDWTTISSIIEENSEVKTFLLDCPEDFTWDEGAHTHFALEGFNAGDKPNRSLVRHMSISTLPIEGKIGITTRIKAQCSEFKTILKGMQAGDKVALFKTHTNVPLFEEGKPLYLLSSGVGLATFRSVALKYLNNDTNVPSVHSLNVDSSEQYLFTDIFRDNEAKNFTASFVPTRDAYYAEVEKLAQNTDALFYVVGSDEFLMQNIAILRRAGVPVANIKLDKHAQFTDKFFNEIVAQA